MTWWPLRRWLRWVWTSRVLTGTCWSSSCSTRSGLRCLLIEAATAQEDLQELVARAQAEAAQAEQALSWVDTVTMAGGPWWSRCWSARPLWWRRG